MSRRLGISFVPDLCLTEHDGLWRISFAGAVPPRRYGAITRRDGFLPLAARRFLCIMAPGSAGSVGGWRSIAAGSSASGIGSGSFARSATRRGSGASRRRRSGWGVSQPALSIHVHELEYELEAALFERGG